jgi:hypothetical protein
MLHVSEGQCGLCTHYGEDHPQAQELIQLRKSLEAAEDLVENCGHPKHSGLHLKVTPVSGCDGFQRAYV